MSTFVEAIYLIPIQVSRLPAMTRVYHPNQLL